MADDIHPFWKAEAERIAAMPLGRSVKVSDYAGRRLIERATYEGHYAVKGVPFARISYMYGGDLKRGAVESYRIKEVVHAEA